MENIQVGKTYASFKGNKVRIIATDRVDSEYPIVGLMADENGNESIECFSKNGRYNYYKASEYDLKEEYNPAKDLKVDQPIWVRDFDEVEWTPRYFAKYENGRVFTFNNGRTSFTAENNDRVTSWKMFKTVD